MKIFYLACTIAGAMIPYRRFEPWLTIMRKRASPEKTS